MVVDGAVDLAAKVTAKPMGESFWSKNSNILAARFAKMLVWCQEQLLINCLRCQALMEEHMCRETLPRVGDLELVASLQVPY